MPKGQKPTGKGKYGKPSPSTMMYMDAPRRQSTGMDMRKDSYGWTAPMTHKLSTNHMWTAPMKDSTPRDVTGGGDGHITSAPKKKHAAPAKPPSSKGTVKRRYSSDEGAGLGPQRKAY